MQPTKWELFNPGSVTRKNAVRLNQKPKSLEGKRVLLLWNGKHNGDILLGKIADLLVSSVKGVAILRSWQEAPETQRVSQNMDVSSRLAERLAGLKPDVSIGAQCD